VRRRERENGSSMALGRSRNEDVLAVLSGDVKRDDGTQQTLPATTLVGSKTGFRRGYGGRPTKCHGPRAWQDCVIQTDLAAE
jgi:hypothetical protein